MKLAVLFSGGKDSVYSAYLAKKEGHELSCLISILSKNKHSYMFHTPSISQIGKQAREMNLPLITLETQGEKEEELKDLEEAISDAIKKYKIEGVVTGAIKSVYQSSRIKRICDTLGIVCLNPLWNIDEISYLSDLIKEKFRIIIVGVFAYPLNKDWLGRIIDEKFVKEITFLSEKYKINSAGEGGEFETFVLDCPLFGKELFIESFRDVGENNSWRREIKIK